MTVAGPTQYLDYGQAARRMAEIIVEASRDPAIIDLALSATQSLSPGDYPSEASALAAIARDCIRYAGDVSGEDLFKYPTLTLQQRAGDCNNKVVLFGSLARAIGFPVRLCFLFDQSQPDFSTDFPIHVYASVDVYKGERGDVQQWIPVELVPLPDRLNGYPTERVPFGNLPSMLGDSFVDCVDVDQVAL